VASLTVVPAVSGVGNVQVSVTELLLGVPELLLVATLELLGATELLLAAELELLQPFWHILNVPSQSAVNPRHTFVSASSYISI
jgi:hypothetical protein